VRRLDAAVIDLVIEDQSGVKPPHSKEALWSIVTVKSMV